MFTGDRHSKKSNNNLRKKKEKWSYYYYYKMSVFSISAVAGIEMWAHVKPKTINQINIPETLTNHSLISSFPATRD